ncbi:MAG: hypothetical protein ACPHRG_08395, partial [Parvibaculales bacterium]
PAIPGTAPKAPGYVPASTRSSYTVAGESSRRKSGATPPRAPKVPGMVELSHRPSAEDGATAGWAVRRRRRGLPHIRRRRHVGGCGGGDPCRRHVFAARRLWVVEEAEAEAAVGRGFERLEGGGGDGEADGCGGDGEAEGGREGSGVIGGGEDGAGDVGGGGGGAASEGAAAAGGGGATTTATATPTGCSAGCRRRRRWRRSRR